MKDYCSYCQVEKEVVYKVYQAKGYAAKRTYVCEECHSKIEEVFRSEMLKMKPDYPVLFMMWLKENDIQWRERIPGRKKTKMR